VAVLAPSAAPPWVGLFNRAAFHGLNGAEPTLVVVEDDGAPAAAVGGVLEDGILTSGASAPFGGIDLARERDAPERVGRLVDALLAAVRARGAHTARLRLPPACHAPQTAALVQFALLNRGFVVTDADLAAHLDLRAVASTEDYVASLRSPARRALKHAQTEPFTAGHAETPADWDAAYAVLAANRAARGRALSLDRDYVERAREALGEAVRMLELRHAGALVAAALSYRVRPDVELVVAWGDAGHALPRSPMNRLALAVVERALAEGVHTIDLGTSTEPGTPALRRVPNAGLCRFKASIGAMTEVRYALEGPTG
jgi:predicted N-acyltransferase